VPAGLNAAEAVSLVLNYTTAYQLIHRIAKLQKGESVLIHGAAGGVGTAALQLGGRQGLKMLALLRRASTGWWRSLAEFTSIIATRILRCGRAGWMQ
jgi:NADPH:quinone reductase-like Zn-dependent oxidoreductase